MALGHRPHLTHDGRAEGDRVVAHLTAPPEAQTELDGIGPR